MKKPFVIFDFDGVIVDSFAPAFRVNKYICPNITEDDYRRGFEGNINDWKMPTNFHSDKCRHDVDFFTTYNPSMKTELQIVPGIDEVINQLGAKYTMTIISSSLSEPIREFLEKNNLAKNFVQILGNDVHTSKVTKMEMVFKDYEIEPKDCVFITDTLGDMREAEKVRVNTIGVTWGFHTLETLLKGNYFQLVHAPAELVPTVALFFENYIS